MRQQNASRGAGNSPSPLLESQQAGRQGGAEWQSPIEKSYAEPNTPGRPFLTPDGERSTGRQSALVQRERREIPVPFLPESSLQVVSRPPCRVCASR